jgi:CDP-glycerol glycerophosphotransferase
MRVVYNSFHGRFSDNPRALYEGLRHRPGIDHVWLADAAHLDAFPAGVRTVDIDSPSATDVLESCDLLVANTHTEVEWRKHPRTTYVQTWHGTPMKRIHHDVLWAPPGRLTRLDADVDKWDLLLSQNAVSTPLLRQAFRFTGEVVETGYPRNDVLARPAAHDRTRRRVRSQLGLSDSDTVVLYAPTWRDDEYFDESGAAARPRFDVEQLSASLGRDHTILVRSHNMMTGRLHVPPGPGIRDVSFWPDISELHAAADLLVTDYSSTMFDFSVTGRPMIFYTDDHTRFRDSTRGFYFDLEPVAPGPLLQDVDDLRSAILDAEGLRSAYASRYDRFRATFCPLDDGHATARTLDRMGLTPPVKRLHRAVGRLPQRGDRRAGSSHRVR